MPMQNSPSPVAAIGSHRSRSASDPRCSIARGGPLKMSWARIALDTSARPSSSSTIAASMSPSPAPPHRSPMVMLNSSALRIASQAHCGNSSVSSPCRAIGARSRSATSRASWRNAARSSVSANGFVPWLPTIGRSVVGGTDTRVRCWLRVLVWLSASADRLLPRAALPRVGRSPALGVPRDRGTRGRRTTRAPRSRSRATPMPSTSCATVRRSPRRSTPSTSGSSWATSSSRWTAPSTGSTATSSPRHSARRSSSSGTTRSCGPRSTVCSTRSHREGAPISSRDVTSQYPVQVICGIAGVPVEDAAQFHQWSEHINTGPLNPEAGHAASQAMVDYLRPLVEARRARSDRRLPLRSRARRGRR